MGENTLQAKRYAQAVFEIAREKNVFDKWQDDLKRVALLAQNSEFVAVMDNPKYSFEDKNRLLKSQAEGVGQMALNLAYILSNQNNFGLITSIHTVYQDLLDSHRGIEKAEITTAVPLDEQEKSNLAGRLSAIIGKKVVLSVKIEPTIIGGIVVRVGGKIIDGSTKNQLASLRNELAGAGS